MTTILEHPTPDGTLRMERIGAEPAAGAAGIHLITFEGKEGAWCLAVFYASQTQYRKGQEQLERWHGRLRSEARVVAATENIERFLPEVLAYVRSLPPDHRSDYLDPDLSEGLEDDRDEAIDDVRRALVQAMYEVDPFRAAVNFEKATPYLRGDIGLVRVMEGILPAFESAVTQAHFSAASVALEKAARKVQGDFSGRQIDSWRRRSGGRDSAVDGRMR